MKTDTAPSDSPVILLVDDNVTNLEALRETLDGHGYRLLIAKSGEDALRIAEKASPDLILLDIMMPGIDGYETCARLKAREKTRDAPIIFLTALQDTKEKVRGLSLGAVDFITKPFDPDEIVARVSRQLDVHHRQRHLLEENRRLSRELREILRAGRNDEDKGSDWVRSLISAGETDQVEFKSTLRWNLKTNRAERAIENAWLKTVVAFLNTDGGVLLVGVEDGGRVLGAEADQFVNDDKHMLYVNNKIKEHIGLEHAHCIRFQLEMIGEQKVLLIECQPSASPVFLRAGKDEDFYIRVGPASRKLTTSEVLAYVTSRRS